MDSPLRNSIDGFDNTTPGFDYHIRLRIERFDGGTRRLVESGRPGTAVSGEEGNHRWPLGEWTAMKDAPITAACIVVNGQNLTTA